MIPYGAMVREVGGTLAVLALASCAWVIDLEERPARPDASNPVEAGSPPCADALFCDGFDEGALGERWTGMPEASLAARLVSNDAGLAMVPFGEASSPPNALEVVAERTGGLTVGFLVQGMSVPAGRAVEAAADVKIRALEDLRDPDASAPDGGPPFATPRLNVLGLYAPKDGVAESAEVVLSSQFVGLVTGQLLENRDTYAIAGRRDYAFLTRSLWIRVTLAVGAADAIAAHARANGRPAPTCAAETIAVVWPSIPTDAVACLPVSATAFASPAGKRIAVAAGLGLGDRSRATVAIDSVRVTVIP
jgi:hypothetical protein